MKRTGIVALLACLVALCLALTACGGGGKKAEEAKAAYVGNWTVYSIESNDGTRTVSNEDIVMLQEMGQTVTLSFSEDDTVRLDIFGNAMNGTWQAKKSGDATADFNGAEVSLSIDAEGKLAFSDGKDKIFFTKGAATSTAPQATSTEDETATDETATDETADETSADADADADAATDEAADESTDGTAEEPAADETEAAA